MQRFESFKIMHYACIILAEYRIVSILFNWNIECWMFKQSYLVTNWLVLKVLRLHQAELAGLIQSTSHQYSIGINTNTKQINEALDLFIY